MAKPTKRDFNAVAKIINDNIVAAATPGTDICEGLAMQRAITNVALDLADYFAAANGQFNRRRFLDACGVDR